MDNLTIPKEIQYERLMGWGNWQDWIIIGTIFGIVILWIVGVVVGWF